MLHIYYGNGKGKTCSAVGAAVRAAGRNKRVLFVQLFKCSSTGERAVLSQLPSVELFPCPKELKFTFEMNEDELERERVKYERALEYIKERRERCDMIVIDEFFTLLDCGFFSSDHLYEYVKDLSGGNCEIILTGHGVDERFTALADYATEFICVSHPYGCGTQPRVGIEL